MITGADDIRGSCPGMEFGLSIPLRTMDHPKLSSGVFSKLLKMNSLANRINW
jgi:hypothetical protein